ncbi:MAG: beta-xylosidase [Anaerolineae bacterium]|nr:beta-xylosidase [Anaerolineae bacterium]
MATTSEAVNIRVDAGQILGELPHNWNYIGYDEINYTYTPEGQELLSKLGVLNGKPYYVRVHHLFCTGNCHGFYKWGSTNAYLEDDDGTPIYNWDIVDLVLDTILKSGCKPFVEMGFMPQQLANPQHYDLSTDDWMQRNYRAYGFASPPKDYQKWYDLIFELAQHCIKRYGIDEVKSWYWELWNEPDLNYYWLGTIEEFNKLYDFTAAAVKAAHPELRVGGPGTTNPIQGQRAAEFLDKFLDHCVNGSNGYTAQRGTPLDFVSFHVKGGGYRADLRPHNLTPPSRKQILSHIQVGYEIIAKYPNLAQLECVLSEIDPDGWAAGGAWDNPVLNFRNTEYYPSFVASTFDHVTRFGQQHQWDVKPLSWAFLFVGERCFEGTRAFSTQGIDKPILNLFKMYGKMGSQEVHFESSGASDPLSYTDICGRGEAADISGFATLSDNSLTVLIYHQHDDWDAAGEVEIALEVENLPFQNGLMLTHYRIDNQHSNAYAEWLRQGKPMYPTPEQYAAIKARDGLEMLEPPQKLMSSGGKISLKFQLPVHGVSLLTITDGQ